MSHEVETLAYSGQVPWHGLGIQVDQDIFPEDMLVQAGLDWTVSLRPLSYQNSAGEWIRSNRSALVRDSDEAYLSAVGENWMPTQNRDALMFFHDFVEKGDLKMETAGSLKGGQHVFALARVNKSFEVTKGDQVDAFVLFHNPHIFGKSREVMTTGVRVVCNNTLTWALQKGSTNKYTATHRMEFDEEAAAGVVLQVTRQIDSYEEMAKFLISKKATEEKVVEYLDQVFPKTKQGDRARNSLMAESVLESQPGADVPGVLGTWWNTFNAVTYIGDHHLGRSQDTRVANAMFGSTRSVKEHALALAVDYAKAA
jgi:phage/plasmid-like protein (TIGR03299 family)